MMASCVRVLALGFVLAALATITAQWLPNWNLGMARVQRAERFAFGLNRFVEDVSVAELVPANNTASKPLFDGSELGVMLVRTAVGPNVHPGLEVVRFRELVDARDAAGVQKLFFRRVGIREHHVVADGAVEEERLLQHDSKL